MTLKWHRISKGKRKILRNSPSVIKRQFYNVELKLVGKDVLSLCLYFNFRINPSPWGIGDTSDTRIYILLYGT